MSQEVLGRYLDRDVCVVAGSSLFGKPLIQGALAHATVFFWLRTERDVADFRQNLKELVGGIPLVLFVAGLHAGHAFEDLLRILADEAPAAQIMTRCSRGTLSECIEEFIQGTWPSEDRFDGWTTYLVVADGEELDALRRASEAILLAG